MASGRLKRETRLIRRAYRYIRCRNRRRLFDLLTRNPELLHLFEEEATLLYRACRWQEYDHEIAEWMLLHGADPDLVEAGEDTLLIDAAAHNDVWFARLLLDSGADIEKPNSQHETPLGYACAWNAVDVVRLLCERGADVNGTEGWGHSYLYGVQCAKQAEIESILISHGAKVIHEEPKLKVEIEEESVT